MWACLKKAIESSDTDAIETEMENLTKASHKLAEIMYQQVQTQAPGAGVGPEAAAAGGPQPDAGAPADSKDDGDVIDAEFEETKD